MKTYFEDYHDIQLEHAGEDYITISYYDISPAKREEVEIKGVAKNIIICLGKALHKESFLQLKHN